MRSQHGLAKVGEETRIVRVSLADGQEPYTPGVYVCNTPCKIDEYGGVVAPRELHLAAKS